MSDGLKSEFLEQARARVKGSVMPQITHYVVRSKKELMNTIESMHGMTGVLDAIMGEHGGPKIIESKSINEGIIVAMNGPTVIWYLNYEHGTPAKPNSKTRS